jgi:pyrimidine operon attenuation protein/uracil phosphoribosyltransferase
MSQTPFNQPPGNAQAADAGNPGALWLDAEALYGELLQTVRATFKADMCLMGVTSGGVWLAQRLQQDMGLTAPIGIISSAMHRDDYSSRGMTAAAQTKIPFDVNHAHILLLDDVLYTGRTIRAVINELFDFGRPASVRLAVLVDRGGRELPIQADICAARISLPPKQSLSLARSDDGQFSFNVRTR